MATEASAEWGRLTCLYNSHQVLQLPWTPFQRKTPETMSASRTRSLINVEMIQILVRKILANTQRPSSARCPRDVTTTDKMVQKASCRKTRSRCKPQMKEAASASQNADAIAITILFFSQSACLPVGVPRYMMEDDWVCVTHTRRITKSDPNDIDRNENA